MPYGTLFQSIPTPPPTSSFHSAVTSTAGANGPSNNDTPNADAPSAASKLAEAIDSFLGDLEKKFQGVSDEILTKLDDMAERCDRLEAELLMKEATVPEGTGTGKERATEGAS